MSDLAIIIPVLRRPQNAAKVYASARAATPDAEILFVCTPGDRTEIEAVKACGANFILTPKMYLRGDYPAKINLGYAMTTAPWIFTGADDLDFRPGWFAACLAAALGGAKVIGTNDLGNPRVVAGEHATHFLVARDYADDPGGAWGMPRSIFFPGYWHERCDDELRAVAQTRGVYAHAEHAIVEHLHPNWGKAPIDDVYTSNRAARFKAGKELYLRRSRLWAS